MVYLLVCGFDKILKCLFLTYFFEIETYSKKIDFKERIDIRIF